MADFKQAVTWMKEGKKVKRADFDSDEYIFIEGTIPKYHNTNTNQKEYFTFDWMDFEAEDWEEYIEP